MPRQLARVLGFLTQGLSPVPNSSTQFEDHITDEVSEYGGNLLVRLGRGSAMQVRLQPDTANAMIRIVPIARATKLEDDSSWQPASESQLQSWIQSGSAIGRWLLAKGLDDGKIPGQMAETPICPISESKPSLSPL